jgi:two-component system, LytTR family, response regulator
MLRAFIVEDEEKGRVNLLGMLDKYCPQVEVVGYAESVSQAVEIFNNPKFQIDLALLDIQLSDGTIFEMLQAIKEIEFDIIFISAHSELAYQCFRYSAIDFILKPIDTQALKTAVEKIRPRHNAQTKERLEILSQSLANPNQIERISIAAVDSIYFVNLKDIVRLEAQDNYTDFYMSNGDKITTSKTIKVYEDMLETKNFYRIHKSHIINVNFIKKIMKGDGGYVIMDDNKQIDVSRRRRPLFMDFLKTLNNEL